MTQRIGPSIMPARPAAHGDALNRSWGLVTLRGAEILDRESECNSFAARALAPESELVRGNLVFWDGETELESRPVLSQLDGRSDRLIAFIRQVTGTARTIDAANIALDEELDG